MLPPSFGTTFVRIRSSRFGAESAGLEADFLNGPVVSRDGGVLTAATLSVVVHHAVVKELLFTGASAVDGDLRRREGARPRPGC